MASRAIVRGMHVALAMTAAAQSFMAELLARQKAREAEGREITDADVDELLGQTSAAIAAERARIVGG